MVALGRLSKSRGGAPRGERGPSLTLPRKREREEEKDAQPHPLDAANGWCACRRSASLLFVARMERSEIREQRASFIIVPGLRFAASGLRRFAKLGRTGAARTRLRDPSS